MMRITWQTVRRITNNILGFVIYETRKLEANWEVIKDEGISLLDQKSGGFIPEEENLREQGDWKQFTLYQRGRKNAAACQKTPQTCAIIDTIKDATSCKRGQVCLERRSCCLLTIWIIICLKNKVKWCGKSRKFCALQCVPNQGNVLILPLVVCDHQFLLKISLF